MRIIFCLSWLFFATINLKSQTLNDSTKRLEEVKIKAYLNEESLISLPSTVSKLSLKQLEQRNTTSLLPSLNSISGVSMEERSPGSYRLSIRGSLLRSPFGIRNIKVYYDDFPLTDAGGNTYLNLIDQNSIKDVEILKGPDGSLFGANSGGVVRLNSLTEDNSTKIELKGGSYGLFSENANFQRVNKNYGFTINQAYQTSDGYRDHSQMERFYLQTQQKWQYNPKEQLKFLGFYSNLDYNTPGGLTQAQMDADPKAARAKADDLKVGITNKAFYAGLAHEIKLNDAIRHVISVSAMHNDFLNPFFTNKESRQEDNFALRTYFEVKIKSTNFVQLRWNLGGEYQNGIYKIKNEVFRAGKTDSLVKDEITSNVGFIFNKFNFQIGSHIKTEISASLNLANYKFQNLSSALVANGSKKFDASLMPRFASSYLFNSEFSLRGVISKGYSLPSTAEVRASDAKINTNLEAENGWNYELGLRFKSSSNKIYVDAAAFYYRLNDAIVRRVGNDDEDFFLNAGGTNQKGLEIQLNAALWQANHSFFRSVEWNSAITLYNFKFRDYKVANNDYSGNLLTGTPKTDLVNSFSFEFPKQLSLFVQHRFFGKTSLNDAATVYAKSYHLLQAKLNWQKSFNNKIFNLAFGADNLLNETYSLGNDLNAFGNRYFNPAAKRNYYVTINTTF